MGIAPGKHLRLYRAIFDLMDVDKQKKLDKETLKPLIKALPLVHILEQEVGGWVVCRAR